ncbi:hypothetical protein ACGFX4_37315 [Kitasatospora sp. NPDC048365]|uniref:hypothetical protein n=1 Tax=Kitasatospora sp. NPDC048365 TaxID=3364050 RepID=UPI00370F8C4C
MQHDETDIDPVRRRLEALVERLRRDLDGVAEIEEKDDGWFWSVFVRPGHEGPLGFWWLAAGDPADIVLGVDAGHVRWELGGSEEDMVFVEEIVAALLRGDATAVFASGRCEVTVTLGDGSSEVETSHESPASLLPLPGWTRWGRRVDYVPYRPRPTAD